MIKEINTKKVLFSLAHQFGGFAGHQFAVYEPMVGRRIVVSKSGLELYVMTAVSISMHAADRSERLSFYYDGYLFLKQN